MSYTLDQLVQLVCDLNADLYPPGTPEDRIYGELTLTTNYYVDTISLGDIPIWDGENDRPCGDIAEIEQLIREKLLDLASFWADARERIYTPSWAKSDDVDYSK
jgi:hypothetical protein